MLVICSMAFDQRLNCMDQRTCGKDIIDFINKINDFDEYTAKLELSVPTWKYIKTNDYKVLENL